MMSEPLHPQVLNKPQVLKEQAFYSTNAWNDDKICFIWDALADLMACFTRF
jgi:hypothetical protein